MTGWMGTGCSNRLELRPNPSAAIPAEAPAVQRAEPDQVLMTQRIQRFTVGVVDAPLTRQSNGTLRIERS